jgi:hypothetical protein
VPAAWRRSIAQALEVDLLDERIAPIDRELGPLLDTIPGIGALLG